MTVDFIGHGFGADPNRTVANYLRSSFGDPNYDIFQGFIAYASLSGIRIFIEKIKERKDCFREIVFYIGIDDNGTSEQALRQLLELEIPTFIYHNPIKIPRAIFHPKIYVFKGDKAHRIIIGSSNVTKPGLLTNVESSVLIEFIGNDSAGIKILNQIEEHFKDLIQKSHNNLAKLTKENLDKWISEGLLYDEEKLFAGEDFIPPEAPKNDNEENFFKPIPLEEISIDELEDIETETDVRIRNRRIVITERYLANWHIGFEKFKNYLKENNTPLVPRDYEDRSFYHWYIKQKVLYKTNLIPTEHFELLEEAGFYFDDSNKLRHRITWEINFEKLKAYHRETGLSYVEDKMDNTDELTFLARWCTRQRLYKRGIRRTLEPYQIEKLDSINFPWELPNNTLSNARKDDVTWLNNLARYSEFKKKYRREPLKKGEVAEESFLGTWCNSQSTNYKRKVLSMTAERIALLEGEGFIWDREQHKFELSVERLLYYFKEKGNFDVPLNYVGDPKLGGFVYRVRTRGTTPERKQRLEILGMTGVKLVGERKKSGKKKSYITREWMINYEKLKSLKEAGIDVNKIDRNYIDKEIGNWLYNQRRRFKKEEYLEQANLLKGLGIIFLSEDRYEIEWNVYYEMLAEHKARKGHCFVKKSYDEDLHDFVVRQRLAWRQKWKSLTPERIEKLEKLDFQWIVNSSPGTKQQATMHPMYQCH